MRVVSDSDVVIHLAKLNKLSLIREIYGHIFIPKYVEKEIINWQYDEVDVIKSAICEDVLRVRETNEERANMISEKYRIHKGEAHAKELAERLSANTFLSNERKVRIVAKKEGFSVAGTIGLILRGVVKNYITKNEATKLLNRLKTSEFRVHPNIIDHAVNSLKKM